VISNFFTFLILIIHDTENDYDNHRGAQLPEEQFIVSEAEAGRPAEEYEPPHQHDEDEEIEQQQHPVAPADLPAAAHDEIPETPVKKAPAVPQSDEKDDDEEEEQVQIKKSSRGSNGITYFPVSFGSTNGGAIAIANSYSTGKGKGSIFSRLITVNHVTCSNFTNDNFRTIGGSASSRATAYGSPAKSKATAKKRNE
jgi:hypothetical protein